MSTPITGASILAAEDLAAFLTASNAAPKINCTPLELATFFIEEAAFLNIRGDIAFCQAIHETGWFKYGGQVLPEQNNYGGLGATNSSSTGEGAWFETPQVGARALMQHLFAYSTTRPIAAEAIVDPRFSLVTRGSAPNWEDLNGKWAVPGTNYGQAILALYADAEAFADTTIITPDADPSSIDTPSSWAAEAWEWAYDNGICDGTRPTDAATREEVVTLIYNAIGGECC